MRIKRKTLIGYLSTVMALLMLNGCCHLCTGRTQGSTMLTGSHSITMRGENDCGVEGQDPCNCINDMGEHCRKRLAIVKKVLCREFGQQIWISGKPINESDWAVDNCIDVTVEGKTHRITGILDIDGIAYSERDGDIPSEYWVKATDITSWIPRNKCMEVTFEFLDLGVKWGYSDVYLIVK